MSREGLISAAGRVITTQGKSKGGGLAHYQIVKRAHKSLKKAKRVKIAQGKSGAQVDKLGLSIQEDRRKLKKNA